jgi:hypothetical protein
MVKPATARAMVPRARKVAGRPNGTVKPLSTPPGSAGLFTPHRRLLLLGAGDRRLLGHERISMTQEICMSRRTTGAAAAVAADRFGPNQTVGLISCRPRCNSASSGAAPPAGFHADHLRWGVGSYQDVWWLKAASSLPSRVGGGHERVLRITQIDALHQRARYCTGIKQQERQHT